MHNHCPATRCLYVVSGGTVTIRELQSSKMKSHWLLLEKPGLMHSAFNVFGIEICLAIFFFLLNSSDSECHWMKKVLFFMTTLMIDIYREIAKNLLLNDNKWLTASSFYRQSHFRIYTRLPETLMLKSVLWLRSGHDTIGPCYTLGCINNHGASCSYEFIVPCISVNRLACFISLKFSSPACFWQPKF